MPIHCICPNGHRFAVHTRFAGGIMVCKRCGETVQLPREEDAGLTDTGILQILGDFEPQHRRPEGEAAANKAAMPERECPRCHRNVPVVLRTCPKCNVYLPLSTGTAAG